MGNRVAQGDRAFVSEIAALRREVQQLRRLGSGGNAVNISSLAAGPACRVFRTTGKAIAASTNVVVDYNDEYEDPWNMHSIASNTHRITAVVAGVYVVGAMSSLPADNTGSSRQLWLVKNEDSTFTGRKYSYLNMLPHATSPARGHVQTVIRLAEGDWMSAVWFHNASGSLTTQNTTEFRDEFWMAWVSN